MQIAEYITQRLDPEIEWYDKKSKSNKCWFVWLRISEIVAAASIPLLNGFSKDHIYMLVISGILGVIIIMITGISGLLRFQENWVSYRTTCETLKHQKYLYQVNAYPYNTTEKDQFFVQTIESIISKENSEWVFHFQKKEERKHGN